MQSGLFLSDDWCLLSLIQPLSPLDQRRPFHILYNYIMTFNCPKGILGLGGKHLKSQNKLKDTSFIFSMTNITILSIFRMHAQKECCKVLETKGIYILNKDLSSDGGNGNHSVSVPIILIKIKVNQILPSSYISSLLVYILWFCIWFSIFMNVQLYFGAKMVTFCIIHKGNRKIFLKHHPPQVPTNHFARKCVLIFYMIYMKS